MKVLDRLEAKKHCTALTRNDGLWRFSSLSTGPREIRQPSGNRLLQTDDPGEQRVQHSGPEKRRRYKTSKSIGVARQDGGGGRIVIKCWKCREQGTRARTRPEPPDLANRFGPVPSCPRKHWRWMFVDDHKSVTSEPTCSNWIKDRILFFRRWQASF